MTNLKDATQISVSSKGLKGECALCVEPSIHAFVRSAGIFTYFAGELPKELGNLINLTLLYLNNNKFRGASYFPAHMPCMSC